MSCTHCGRICGHTPNCDRPLDRVCPRCRSVYAHAPNCPNDDYRKPYFSADGFLQADWREEHVSRTVRDVREMLGRKRSC